MLCDEPFSSQLIYQPEAANLVITNTMQYKTRTTEVSKEDRNTTNRQVFLQM